MKALRLVLSLVLVPRLFATLLLFPLLITLVVVYVQVVATGVVLHIVNRDSRSFEAEAKNHSETNFVRQIIYGNGKRLPPIRVCRWGSTPEGGEAPPSPECKPDRLDVAVNVADPAHYNPASYVDLFEGNFERLHICKTCQPDLVVSLTGTSPRLDAFSIWSLSLMSLVNSGTIAQESRSKILREEERIESLLGPRYFHSSGLGAPVLLSDFLVTFAVVMNLASFVIITLWLALRAHRKILDYFVRNGALLPMVAACGKNEFYSALWMLTGLRVLLFMGGSAPFFIELYGSYVAGTTAAQFLTARFWTLLFWGPALMASLSLATIIASVADLKHRHHLLSFTYRYVPFVLSLIGHLLWSFTFIFEGTFVAVLRNIITVLPVLGIGPVMLAPLVSPPLGIVVAHAVLSCILVVVVVRNNARWFAAHLEDL